VPLGPRLRGGDDCSLNCSYHFGSAPQWQGQTDRQLLLKQPLLHRSQERLNDTLYPTLDRDDGNSHFEEGVIDLPLGERGDILSGTVDVISISLRETRAGGAFEWDDAPARQFVIRLSGTLDFETRTGEHFVLRTGDILLAEDTAGTGHSWKLVDEQPWRRAYVIL
jgi:quercetin dioxygenase-like cupin family protein